MIVGHRAECSADPRILEEQCQGRNQRSCDNGGDQIWTSSTHVVIQTNAGRITRTVGLPTAVERVVFG